MDGQPTPARWTWLSFIFVLLLVVGLNVVPGSAGRSGKVAEYGWPAAFLSGGEYVAHWASPGWRAIGERAEICVRTGCTRCVTFTWRPFHLILDVVVCAVMILCSALAPGLILRARPTAS